MDNFEKMLLGSFRVAVLCGGESSEREVSLVSGKAVARGARAFGLPVDLFELDSNNLPPELSPKHHVVLPVVHGQYGEDGQLSADLETGGFAYGGSSQAASVLCFDKLACKLLAAKIGIPVAADMLLNPGERPSHEALVEYLGEPYILKPRSDGSSVGLYLVRGREDFEKAGADLDSKEYLAEAYQEGFDLTVGILEGKALGVVAVHPEGGLYDYQHKYTSGMSRYEVPANIPTALEQQLCAWSEGIFKLCGCRDIGRVDFRAGRDGKVVFLEVNTIPGMTPTSLLPKSAQCRNITFEKLVGRWIELSYARMRKHK